MVRSAKLRHEWFEFLDNPLTAVRTLQETKFADLFTFLRDIDDNSPPYPFHRETASAAVLPVTTYDTWWNDLDPRVRNKIRKAHRMGIEVREVQLDDDFVRGVGAIYSETPLRQGRKFCHYGQSAAAIKEELSSLWGRCYFLSACLEGEMLGFAKLCHGNNILRTVHIIAKLSERDKPVQDALIARAVQICEEKGVRYLQYGSLSEGGLGACSAAGSFRRAAT